MPNTNLSTIKPDFSQLVSQLQTILSTKPAWVDLYQSGTGQTLIELIASIGELDQYAIEQAYKEGFLDTAITDSAVYAITRMLGVRIPRKQPATMVVTFSRTDTSLALTIPAFSVFTCNSVTLFNREAFTFTAGSSSLVVTLYEGVVRSFQLFAAGTDFQMFKSTESGFQVSDQDIKVTSNNNDIPVITNGIWNYSGESAVQDTTTKDGELLLTFGNDNYGFKPANNVQVDITYTVTRGVTAADSTLAGQKVAYVSDSSITGVVGVGGLTGGGDQVPVDTLQQISPLLFSAQGQRATTKSEFAAVAMSYPGVKDALIVGQRELAPADLRFMNLARISLLTDNPITNTFYNDFIAWYTKRTMFPVRFYRQDPIQFPVTITANIYCSSSADLLAVKANVTAAINALFQPRQGYIGYNVFKSDIYEAINASDTHVEYVELLSPTTDVIVDVNSPKNLQATAMNNSAGGVYPPGTGVLPAGSYVYGVSTVNATGESLVTNFISVTRTDTGINRVTWDKVFGAVSYKIYGRTTLSRGFIASVTDTGASSYAFYDTGSIVPAGPLPTLDSSGIHYATLAALNLTVYYSQRGIQ